MKQFDQIKTAPQLQMLENDYPIQTEIERIWLHGQTGEFYFNTQPIEGLSPLQRRILAYLLDQPAVYLTKTEIINGAWPTGIVRSGVSDDALFHQMSVLRKILRQYSSHRFIVTWRGIPEGGYRLLSNGISQMDKWRF